MALVGASGVGKTTLCSLIPRFYQPEEGQVLLDGVPVQSVTLSSLRRNIGLVQQDVYLFTGTVAENIAYGRPGASREGGGGGRQKGRGPRLYRKAAPGLRHGHRPPRSVGSPGGQQQRLSIARVFLKDPPVLLFDEATSALDAHSEKVVQRSLEQLVRHRNHPGHRPPAVHHPERRAHFGAGRARHLRGGHPPGADGQRRGLRRAVPDLPDL